MRTAEERAAELVTSEWSESQSAYLVRVGGWQADTAYTPEARDHFLDRLRTPVADILRSHAAEAVAEALALPVPSPVSEERLAEIRGLFGSPGKWTDGPVSELLRHIDFLSALVRDLSADGVLGAYKEGRAAGRREQHAAAVEAAIDAVSRHSGQAANIHRGADAVLVAVQRSELEDSTP